MAKKSNNSGIGCLGYLILIGVFYSIISGIASFIKTHWVPIVIVIAALLIITVIIICIFGKSKQDTSLKTIKINCLCGKYFIVKAEGNVTHTFYCPHCGMKHDVNPSDYVSNKND